jgi:type II secretory pathway component PulC
VVIGVIYDTEAPEDSVAIIFDRETGKQENLFVGDEYKGWKFESVKDRVTVVLVKGEERREIGKTTDKAVVASASAGSQPQPGPNNPGKALPGANNPSGLNPNQPGGRNPKQPTNPNSNVVTPSNEKKTIPRSFIEQLNKNRDQYIQQVFAKPYYEAGRPIGMEVVKIDQQGPLRYFGIQQGDVILTWNGQTINSEAKCYDLMKQYNDVRTIPNQNNIVLIRNGQRVNLNIELR